MHCVDSKTPSKILPQINECHFKHGFIDQAIISVMFVGRERTLGSDYIQIKCDFFCLWICKYYEHLRDFDSGSFKRNA